MKGFDVVTPPPSGTSYQKKNYGIPKNILLKTFESNIGGPFLKNSQIIKAEFLNHWSHNI